MTPLDALPTVAEIAITLGGFIGLLVVFKPAATASWTDEERARVVFVLLLCTMILFCALLPFALSGMIPDQSIVWGVPLLLFGFGNLILVLLMLLRIRSGRVRIQFPLISWPILVGWTVLTVCLLLSGVGVFWPQSPGVLLLGMLGSLIIGAITLTALMAQSMNRDGE